MGEIDVTQDLQGRYGFPFLVEKNRELEAERDRLAAELVVAKVEKDRAIEETLRAMSMVTDLLKQRQSRDDQLAQERELSESRRLVLGECGEKVAELERQLAQEQANVELPISEQVAGLERENGLLRNRNRSLMTRNAELEATEPCEKLKGALLKVRTHRMRIEQLEKQIDEHIHEATRGGDASALRV